MSPESLTNRGEYLSAHYLAEILPTTLKGSDLVKRWAAAEKDGEQTPRTRLRALRRAYFDAKTELADEAFFDPERLRKLHRELLRALGFDPETEPPAETEPHPEPRTETRAEPRTVTVERAGQEHVVTVAYAELGGGHGGIVALDCGWAVDTEAAQDPDDAGRLLTPVTLTAADSIDTGAKLASWLFAADEPRPRYVLLLSGGVVTLADRGAWGEGRYLAVSLDTLYARNDDREYDVVAALFGADSLRPPAEGGTEPLAELVTGSRQHAVGVSGELREGLKVSVELIANEVLDRIRQAGYRPEQVMALDELARELGREALRYLYRILFLLYAEARPELGVLPVNDREYVEGYSLARLGDLVARRLPPSADGGFHLYDSLDLLFRMVNEGHRERAGATVDEHASEGEGLRFEPMRSDLFLPERTRLIGRLMPAPGDDEDDDDPPTIDTRLRNKVLYQVLRRLMLTKGGKRRRGGFISYAQLGINQLGAVYEGLMSYTGFVATEPLYEVAKNGDPKDGSWMIPASRADEYDDAVFVYKEDPYTGVRSRVSHDPGAFVWRLAGRDRQTSASYYTPQSLTEVTVQLALKYRLDQDDTVTPARELLDWTICEPALGSGAFLNEAINQVAAEYLRRRQKELAVTLDPEDYHLELQRVKAYIALHNCYGVDLNRTAVELAEVSLWLNVMHAGLQAPWFGLHLRRGNSLIGCGRKTYDAKQLTDKSWLTTAPQEKPFRHGDVDSGAVHHFLLPADGWGAVAGEKEARELAPAETAKLKAWRTAMRRTPTAKGKNPQVRRLQALARRVEFLWGLVQQRLAISEAEIRRDIPVWGADDLPPVTGAVEREKILADLTAPGTPYWRLKTLMDVWCALWFWPLDAVGLLDGSDPAYPTTPVEVSQVRDVPADAEPTGYEVADFFGNVQTHQVKPSTKPIGGTRQITVAEKLRRQVPLTSLDDWLTFAEALIGRKDADEDDEHFYGLTFTSLDEMSAFEQKLDGVIGVDAPWTLTDRFPWLLTAEQIADQQGFFHWELTFAQAFTNGFDLQVGNPPWVQPDWMDASVLAEVDPWFMVAAENEWATYVRRRQSLLETGSARDFYLSERSVVGGSAAFTGSPIYYQVLGGGRADFYRCFIAQVWRNATVAGISGLLHPGTHLTGPQEGSLRPEAYRRLRILGSFVNVANWAFAPPVGRKQEFGVNVYGRAGEISFVHASKLYSVETFRASLNHDGNGEIPGIKNGRNWDRRPHRDRLIRVDRDRLEMWRRLLNLSNAPVESTPLLHPVTTAETAAMEALARAKPRLRDCEAFISVGFNERTDKVAGLFYEEVGRRDTWEDVILNGPNFSLATPFAKQDPQTGNFDQPVDLEELTENFLPSTKFRPPNDRENYERKLDNRPDGRGGRRSSIEFYRLFWREMTKAENERSLFVALFPPGPSHVHAVRSMAMGSDLQTALVAGFWSALPLDYLLRVTDRDHMSRTEALVMPVPEENHPLQSALLLRTLRLNALTSGYGQLWNRLFRESWQHEEWALNWPSPGRLGDVPRTWDPSVPIRSELMRRSALLEIDALVAVWLGMEVEPLLALYKSRYGTLAKYETAMYFDAAGRKIAADRIAWGRRQRPDTFAELEKHLSDPAGCPAPKGYAAPFYHADRESEYRLAHSIFSERYKEADISSRS
ncbi:class I SAM-dependent DNA methyltransferase [Micromonospora sp. WMMD882]|uniref:class I SAM-dependent DNA methyltransferase n=1 Tax=Micromonospora sp. WMMD882 TaxID=3015151 RepID=UPI00248D1E04|nr:class I SAM-dependent DNA methyltransferase [Micromonospora sp. WMMD882]WBB80416.1 class I SAM-dependent DNA methyltransferase [Micromonospora sp. WMMD882]